MILSLFRKDPVRDQAEALCGAIFGQARNPIFYRDFGTPDTPDGRFEQISLHAWLVLRRLKEGGSAEKELSQMVFDIAVREYGPLTA